VKRAVELFTIERRPSCSPFIEETWQTRSESEESFISVAASHWEMVVTRQQAAARLTVRGPETKATTVPIPQDAEFFGLQFSLGTYMPSLLPGHLVDRSLTLPPVTRTSFWLDGSAWELPGPGNADVFADRLVRAGLLVHDPVVSGALWGDVRGLSTRTVQRRVSRATGLTRGAIRQIHRTETALSLLAGGMSAAEVARRAGYADQSHLTRSFRRLVGQTPSQIVTSAAGEHRAVAFVQDGVARSG
jgi:AraC-like DNA-binding protein